MATKRLKLFGITIWEIETTPDPVEEAEEEEAITEPYTLGTHISTPQDPPPTFGFITNWGWDDE
jgi:hypothetical protein